FAYAGIRAAPTTATVNGVAKTTVNRLWDVDNGFPAAFGTLGTAAGNVEVAVATSNFVNTGSISSVFNGGPSSGVILVSAANGIRNGTAGDSNILTGMFADTDIILNAYSATGKTEVYNVISGYITNKTLPIFAVN